MKRTIGFILLGGGMLCCLGVDVVNASVDEMINIHMHGISMMHLWFIELCLPISLNRMGCKFHGYYLLNTIY